jgi:L-ascorbate metabolism protein UlaG (beta-lactamase superfamily)
MNMKNKLIVAVFLMLLPCTKIFGNDSISITYIANCGFLIEMDSYKIIIDGLFKRGHNYYPVPDTVSQKLLVSNQYPFNDIDLILVSHVHEDHFDKDMVIECMLNNPLVKLLCPQQVMDRIIEAGSVYDQLKSRMIECTPDTFTSQFIRVEDIEIYACRLPHPGERHKNVQNIAYLISVHGKTVFHSADIDPHQIDRYTGIKLNEMDIDIGFINEDFSRIENASLAKEFINAKHNIAMHLPDPVAKGWSDSVKAKPDLYMNPFLFTEKMEKKTFSTE